MGCGWRTRNASSAVVSGRQVRRERRGCVCVEVGVCVGGWVGECFFVVNSKNPKLKTKN